MLQSSALSAQDRFDVDIAPEYSVLQEVMSKYYGIMDGLNLFLKELSHPLRNWQFIVNEARGYSLNYFHLLKDHPRGNEAAEIFVKTFAEAVRSASDPEVKADACDNLLLFLQKIIRESDTDMDKFQSNIADAFHRIGDFEDEDFFFFVKSFYQITKLAELLSDTVKKRTERDPMFCFDFTEINLLLIKYFRHTYTYWLNEEDPWIWFQKETEESSCPESLSGFFKEISHEDIRGQVAELDKITASADFSSSILTSRLTSLQGYNHFAEVFRGIPRKLSEAGKENGQGKNWKVIFLFHIMNTAGLSMIHEEALRDINRTLSLLISRESSLNIERIIRKTFSILKARIGDFPATALNCVLNMGKGVYETDESDLITLFIDSVIDLGFQAPMIRGVGNDWQVQVNSAHLQNVRTWPALIELNPKYSTRLLSYLIIHLSLCGVFIKDTDLFPRDITRLLNSNIEPVYNLVRQLAKLFPVYFNDIGAEGELRDISTKIDELTLRKDILIHFLRKQVHVESSSRTIGFIEAVFRFWATGEKKSLEPFVPPNIYERIEAQGDYFDGIHAVISYLVKRGIKVPEDFLTLKPARLKACLEEVSLPFDPESQNLTLALLSERIGAEDIERVELSVALYKLLRQKYDFASYSEIGAEMEKYLSLLKSEDFPDIGKLKSALTESTESNGSLKRKIIRLLDYLESLKDLVLSSQSYEIREDIYKKRHFTVDIPSMYGSYHETKFDALGLMFRIEALVNALFDQLIERIDLSLITKATFYQIYSRLRLFSKALKLEGISTVEIERQLDFLAHAVELRGFTFTQCLDVFRGFAQAVKNIIADNFNNVHEENLTRILSRIPISEISEKYVSRKEDNPACSGVMSDSEQHRISEIFCREKIAMSLGLQQLDVFLTRILNTLFHQAEKLHKDHLQQLLIYDPQSAMVSIGQAAADNTGIIYLGNKGYNLVKLRSYGLSVPPGFIITTEVFRFREMIESYPPAAENFREQVKQHILAMEKETGRIFGDPGNPMLLSVRSGSSISQPGMMDTFLDVGLNEKITEGLAAKTGNPWFAFDSWRRFLQCYGMAFGLKRDDFDAVIGEFKRRLGIPYKKDFSPVQMKAVALAYKQLIQDSGIAIVEEPFEQLLMTIRKVFDSWESPKAVTYRRIMGISDDWGTAVTVQSMVFGNISRNSGTGVFFTHNPRWSGDSLRLWGDFTLGNQGEDVVAGLVNTMPISIIQQDIEMRDTDITLESHFPQIYSALNDWSNELVYKRGWSPQEIEFTFEGPSAKDLYLLQSRDMTIRGRRKVLTFNFEKADNMKLLGHGIGVSGGAMSGRAVFSLEEIGQWRKQEPETSLILLRGDTVPDDIREIYAADGLLTARGGQTSHAAVVAHRLVKTCVVGCGNFVCDEKEKTGRFDQVIVRPGDYISIDGREGSVYQGIMEVRSEK